ncbi:MAG: hypothetical protein ACJ77K_13175 [Bacteroidia bacterium]
MRFLLVSFFFFISLKLTVAQNAVYTICGKSGNCTMTWDEFTQCKKSLITTDKAMSVSAFVVTVKKLGKKDYEFMEYTSKTNNFPKEALEMIDKLKKDKKLGDTIEISNVEVVQSGKAARKVNGMIITLN